ncbi:hypothetical protein BA190_26920 [Labrys sp. WJW]|uniref:hypothetical protein n=1 Tax=Labrys sp. WJW TaxID=1737983 RepID=UPI00083405C6|nr:hypothetical protein [Labrys sp. WJW]OCC01848.1 hypothetical protein BA190_26920 [Labrys sp. WJW]
MIRSLVFVIALLAATAVAQAKGTPTLQIDNTGTTRCLTVWDLTSPNVDKGIQIGCVDTRIGSWDLPVASRNLSQITERELRAFGYRGDNVSRTLASAPTINGRPTTGWTLAQWQAILPAATALTDELDWVVLQSFIKAAGSNPISINLGPGKPTVNKTLSACGPNVRINGSGAQSTVFNVNADVDLINYCQGGSDPLVSARVELENFGAVKTANTSANYALQARFRPQTNLLAKNLNFQGFNNCIRTENGAGMVIDTVFCYTQRAGGSTGLGTGLEIQGGPHTDAGTGQAVGGTFINHISNNLMQGYELGYRFYALGAGLEDQRVTNSAAGGVRRGLQITGAMTGSAGNYSPFEISIDNFSCDATTTCLDIDRGWHTTIRGGDFLLAPAIASTTWNGTGADFIRICRADTVTLRDAFISNNAQAIAIGDFIHVRSDNSCGLTGPINPLVVQITGNTIEAANLAFTSSVFKADAGSVGILFKDNVFTSSFVPIEPPANYIVWNNTDNNSALFRNVNLGFTAQSNPAAFAISTNSNFNAASLSLPPGKWLCQGNIQYLPAGGTTLAVVQGALNTTSATIPANGVQGGFQEVTNQSAGQGGIFNTGSYAFDLTASSTIYLVGVAQFSGGTSNANGNLQCVRIR